MKRFFCLFLALLLLATAGCAPDTPAPATDPADAPAGTETEPSTPETEPSTAPGQTPPAGLAFSLPALPEIGEYYSGEKNEPFFASGPADDFTPREDYGAVLPYCGDVTYFRDVSTADTGWDESTYMCSYGLMTAQGQVITKPQWDSFVFYPYGGGTGFYRLGNDLIDVNGRWALHFDTYAMVNPTPFQRGRTPRFLVESEASSAVYSAVTGEKLLSLEAYTSERPDFAPGVSVIFADDDMLLLTQTAWDGGDCILTCTALDWNGGVLYTKALKNRTLFNDGGRLMRQSSYYSGEEYRLLDTALSPVSDRTYRFVAYDCVSGYTMGVYGSGVMTKADYFDPDGAPAAPETGWTAAALNRLGDDSFFGSETASFFLDKSANAVRDFFGNEIALPAPAERILPVLESGSGGWEPYLYLRDAENTGYLLTPAGETLLSFLAPYELAYGAGEYAVFHPLLTVGCGMAAVISADGGFYVYDMDTQETVFGGTLADVFGDGVTAEEYNRKGCSLNFLPGGLMAVHREDRAAVYDARTGKPLYPHTALADHVNGVALIATPTESVALDADGNVLVRVIIDKNV